MTDKMINVLAGFFLVLIFFKFIEKLSKKKILNKNSSKEERLVDYYSSVSLIICTFISSVYSREKFILYAIGAYLLSLLLLKVFMSDRKKFKEIDILKTRSIIFSLIFTVYQFVFFLNLEDGSIIKSVDSYSYINLLIILMIIFFILNIYFLKRLLWEIFTRKDRYRIFFTIIDVIFIFSQIFFIIYNLLNANRFDFYMDKFL